MSQQRPIKPHKDYVQKIKESQEKIETKTYLKRANLNILPCQRESLNHHKTQRQLSILQKKSHRKSKAKLYEEIKKKNIQKFGQKKEPSNKIIQKKTKKINPEKMTVNYKTKPKIDIEQTKKGKKFKNSQELKQIQEQQKKNKYQKLLNLYGEEMDKLNEEKQKFKLVAQKLSFKQSIKDQPGLQIENIQKKINKILLEKLSQAQLKQSFNQQEQVSKQSRKKSKRNLKTKQQTQSLFFRTKKQLQKFNKFKIEPSVNQEIKIKSYCISQTNLLPQFTPKNIFEFIDIKKFEYDQNHFYKEALHSFTNKLNRQCHFQGPQKIENEQNHKQLHGTKIKWKDGKRVTKYQEGWIEVWIPGCQRLMKKQEYKVVWLGNGDVLQEFPFELKSYYSKSKDIYQLNFAKNPPIYYELKLGQIWQQFDDKKIVVYSDGREQQILKE